MATSGIQATIDCYIVQEADLANQIVDIMTSITSACRSSADLAQTNSDKKANVRSKYEKGSDEYKEAMDKVQDEYNVKLADITAWESQLNTRKESLETEIKVVQTNKESFQSMLKQNTQNDKYGGQ